MQRSPSGRSLRVVVLATAFHRSQPRRVPLPRFRSEGGDLAIGRVHDERAPPLAIDDGDPIAGLQPEIVVAAHVACRAGRSIAALRRGRPVRIARLVETLDAIRHALLEPGDILFRHHQTDAVRALERRDRAVAPGALEVRTAIRRARHGPWFRFGGRAFGGGLCRAGAGLVESRGRPGGLRGGGRQPDDRRQATHRQQADRSPIPPLHLGPT